jgi:hypothetical protein
MNRYTAAVMKVTSSANVRRPAIEQLFRNIATRRHVVVRLSKHTEVDTECPSGFLFQLKVSFSCRHARDVLGHFSASIINTSDELNYTKTTMHTTK